MPAPSLTYTLTNGSTADASQVMQDLNDLLNGITDGTKDLSISALTVAGTLTANGNVNLGNASGDDLTITASLASTIPIKTTASYDIGSSTLGLRAIYFGRNGQTVNVVGSSSMSATWTLTLPVSAGTANYLLTTNGSGVTSWTAISDSNFLATSSAGGTVSYYADNGTFTPTLKGSTADPTSISYTAQHGFYVRIGKLVVMWGRLGWDAATGGTGTLRVGAIPFAATGTSNYRAQIFLATSNIAQSGITSDGWFTGEIEASQQFINVNHSYEGSGQASTSVGDNNGAVARTIFFSGCYLVA